MTGRIEVIGRVSGRRFWSVEQKLTILRDAFGPGGSVRLAIERHEVSSGVLYTWRRKAMAGLLLDRRSKTLPASGEETGASFAEVRIADPVAMSPPASLPPPESERAGKIAIELPSGIRLSVETPLARALARQSACHRPCNQLPRQPSGGRQVAVLAHQPNNVSYW